MVLRNYELVRLRLLSFNVGGLAKEHRLRYQNGTCSETSDLLIMTSWVILFDKTQPSSRKVRTIKDEK